MVKPYKIANGKPDPEIYLMKHKSINNLRKSLLKNL